MLLPYFDARQGALKRLRDYWLPRFLLARGNSMQQMPSFASPDVVDVPVARGTQTILDIDVGMTLCVMRV